MADYRIGNVRRTCFHGAEKNKIFKNIFPADPVQFYIYHVIIEFDKMADNQGFVLFNIFSKLQHHFFFILAMKLKVFRSDVVDF